MGINSPERQQDMHGLVKFACLLNMRALHGTHASTTGDQLSLQASVANVAALGVIAAHSTWCMYTRHGSALLKAACTLGVAVWWPHTAQQPDCDYGPAGA